MNEIYSSVLLIAQSQDKDFIDPYLKGIVHKVIWAQSISKGITILHQEKPEAVLLSLSSREDVGEIPEIIYIRPGLPIVIINTELDYELAAEALRVGGQDFLVKGYFDALQLKNAIHFAIERQNVLERMRTASYYDELTGLYNRRGFITLAEHQIRVAERNHRAISLFFIDMDNMKWINDTYGHKVGDQAICRVGDILRCTYRSSDIIARFGGDEFVVMALGFSTSVSVRERLGEKLEQDKMQPTLSLSIGEASFDPENPVCIEELLIQADENMYKHKRNRINRTVASSKTSLS